MAKFILGANPFQAGQVVKCGLGDRRGGHVEALESLEDGERGGFEAVGGVGGIAGGDLGLDQGAQHLFGGPALGLGHLQYLGCGAAHRSEFEPAQPGIQIRGQERDRFGSNSFRAGSGGHAPLPSRVIL
jgi:hypothetical protein